MRRGVDCGGILFFRLFPPARHRRFSAPQPGCVYVLLTIKGTHRFTRAFIIISPLFRDCMELHRFPARENHYLYCGALSPPFIFTLAFYYRAYCPRTIRINVISCLRILDPLWILSSPPAWRLLIYLSLDSNLLASRVISPRVFSLKILSERRRGELEFQIESYCAKDAPFSAVNCIPVVCASSEL